MSERPPKSAERFARLEKARTEPYQEKVELTGSARFEGITPPPLDPKEPPPRAARFDAAPEGIDLDRPSKGEQPFIRCAICGVDASRFVAACPRCGASLETALQREYNEQLWQKQQAERETATSAPPDSPAGGVMPIPDRTFAEGLAREAAESALARMGMTPSRPLLFRLLGQLPPPWRYVVGALLIAVPSVVIRLSRSGSGLHLAALATLGLILVLAVPPRAWRS